MDTDLLRASLEEAQITAQAALRDAEEEVETAERVRGQATASLCRIEAARDALSNEPVVLKKSLPQEDVPWETVTG